MLLQLTRAQDHSRPQDNSFSDIFHTSGAIKDRDANSLYGKIYYFNNNWVKAKILMADNTIISNDSLLFNFDKLNLRLLFTSDLKKIYELDRREFKAVLFYWHDSAFVFKHIDLINDKDLFQVIIGDRGKYSLYKVTHSRPLITVVGGVSYFTSATERYEDLTEYFLLFPNKEYKKIYVLKRGAIERAFSLNPDMEKVDTYLNATGKKEYQEDDLIQLVLYLNKLAV
jgi:hypothetical protein